MTEIEIGIMHASFSPARRELLKQLVTGLDHYPVSLSVDGQGLRNCWIVFEMALRMVLETEASHVLIMSDDALPCKDFIPTAYRILELLPSELIGFYCPTKHVKKALDSGRHWLNMRDGAWGLASLIPACQAREFLLWQEAFVKPTCQYDDVRLALWSYCTGRSWWVTAPSILQHNAPAASELGNNNKNHVAPIFHAGSGLLIDWRKGLEDPLQATSGMYSRNKFELKEAHVR